MRGDPGSVDSLERGEHDCEANAQVEGFSLTRTFAVHSRRRR